MAEQDELHNAEARCHPSMYALYPATKHAFGDMCDPLNIARAWDKPSVVSYGPAEDATDAHSYLILHLILRQILILPF